MNTIKQIRNYKVRQDNWVKANNLKVGDKVIIKKRHESHTKGWSNSWVNEMDDKVKTVQHIKAIRWDGIELCNELAYPYTVLQKLN
jgi:intein/homing endonuclease